MKPNIPPDLHARCEVERQHWTLGEWERAEDVAWLWSQVAQAVLVAILDEYIDARRELGDQHR